MINTIIELRLWVIEIQKKHAEMDALEQYKHDQIVKAVASLVILVACGIFLLVRWMFQ